MSFLSQSNKQAFRNPWVIGWILLLLVVVAVNAGFIITAFKTSPGLVKDDYYEQGRDYERTVQQLIAARERLGWRVILEPGTVKVGQPATLNISVLGRSDEPVTGLDGYLQLYRPSDRNQDTVISLSEVGNGEYQASYTVMLKGVWDLLLTLQRGEDRYTAEQRIEVEP
jgi:nitrogen fixation protein FixH